MHMNEEIKNWMDVAASKTGHKKVLRLKQGHLRKLFLVKPYTAREFVCCFGAVGARENIVR